MANFPPAIPPLMSDSPPPIDFDQNFDDDNELPSTLGLDDEDDDEFGAFGLPTALSNQLKGSNLEALSLPHTPVDADLSQVKDHSFRPIDIPPLFDANKNKEPHVKPVEAINLDLLESLRDNESQPIAEDDADLGGAKESNTEELDVSAADPPSLQFDKLSLSSGNRSNLSSPPSLSLSAAEVSLDDDVVYKTTESAPQQLELRGLPNLVTLEDIEDDISDDEQHSPRKPNSGINDENSDEFFTIQILPHAKVENSADKSEIVNDKEIEISDVEFDDFACFQNEEPIDIKNFKNTELPTLSTAEDFAFEADFGAFESAASESTDVATKESNINEHESHDKDDDDFDDFQDFSFVTPPKSVEEKKVEFATTTTTANTSMDDDDDDDDDFGDFEEATVLPSPISIVPCSESNTSTHEHSKARIVPVLEMLFPMDTSDQTLSGAYKKLKAATKLDLKHVDSARALDYQWSNSEVRHALIRSLGIDSRNILFGEKWNSSMPRYAANLSFNPLQPVKSTQQTSKNSSTGGESSYRHKEVGVTAEVPAAEFDWNSAGLVNPLDGSKNKEDTNSRETETIHTTESGKSDSFREQQQQQQQYATPIDQSHNDSSYDDAVQANNDADTTATPSGVFDATTTTTLSPNVASDSISNNVHNNDFNTDIAQESLNQEVSNNFGEPIKSEQIDLGLFESVLGGLEESQNTMMSSSQGTSNGNGTNNMAALNIQIQSSFGIVDDGLEDEENEVITTTTYPGPLKETHIYTPSKGDVAISKTIRVGAIPAPIPTAAQLKAAIDFDYEMAAAGIIIDETVVKKEYRDIEYNPGFGLEFTKTEKTESLADAIPRLTQSMSNINEFEMASHINLNELQKPEEDDDFSDFQSVPPPPLAVPTTTTLKVESIQITAAPKSVIKTKTATNSRTGTPTFGEEMILSPAILLPQAISMKSNKPKIEWGDSANTINPEELARIEELFPQPKQTLKTKETSNTPRSSPTHGILQHSQQNQISSLSISATVAQKEQSGINDDDDWSDFVSVPAAVAPTHINAAVARIPQQPVGSNNNKTNKPQTNSYNSHASPLRQLQNVPSPHKLKSKNTINNSNDDEWSDFVSSTPQQTVSQSASNNIPVGNMFAQQAFSNAAPQFNSAAWQGANFYNNPLSFYHQNHSNVMPRNMPATQKYINHNNNNNNNSIISNNYNNNNNNNNNLSHSRPINNNQQQTQFQGQHVHVMQDLSITAPYRSNLAPPIASSAGGGSNSSQFQVGSAKVAPSVSLIPDLGFVTPAVPAHTTFVNSLPKSSFSTKK